jgi:hypothetical protein
MRKGQLVNYSVSFDGKESDPLSDRTERTHSRCIILNSDNNMNTIAFPSPKNRHQLGNLVTNIAKYHSRARSH